MATLITLATCYASFLDWALAVEAITDVMVGFDGRCGNAIHRHAYDNGTSPEAHAARLESGDWYEEEYAHVLEAMAEAVAKNAAKDAARRARWAASRARLAARQSKAEADLA